MPRGPNFLDKICCVCTCIGFHGNVIVFTMFTAGPADTAAHEAVTGIDGNRC